MDVNEHSVVLPDGRSTSVFTLSDGRGLTVKVAALGATLIGIEAPDAAGRVAPALLGSDDLSRYPAAGAPPPDHYLGATCGRVANRIANARFTLDGTDYPLSPNEPPNHVHGGADGFHRAIWRGERLADGVRLRHQSPDGDQGYPGAVDAVAEFRLTAPGGLLIAYQATTDAPTHVNLVSHGYFNLTGRADADVLDHDLRIAADTYLPIDDRALPLDPSPVAGTPFDFRAGRRLGDGLGSGDPQIIVGDGYNHCFVLDDALSSGAVRPVARLSDPGSGRTLLLSTDQPGLQLYTGNALDGSFARAPNAPGHKRRSGLCLEAQALPNAPNRSDFPSTRLDPGQTYLSRTLLRFGVGDTP